jgi:hypothetical protein
MKKYNRDNLVINSYSYKNYHSKNGEMFYNVHPCLNINCIYDDDTITFSKTINFSDLFENLKKDYNYLDNIEENIIINLDVCYFTDENDNLFFNKNYKDVQIVKKDSIPTCNNTFFLEKDKNTKNILMHFRRDDLIYLKNDKINVIRDLSTFEDYINVLNNNYRKTEFNICICTDHADKNKEKISKTIKDAENIYDFMNYNNKIIYKKDTCNKFKVLNIYYKDEELYNIFYYSDIILSHSCLVWFLYKLFNKNKKIFCGNELLYSIKVGEY